ncbi:unnamed protein product [Phytomonas sp. Hart1]|nr:unnamed protein product [Phytomonas sp. Hart1]|eukprot:CCW68130.1 unnamed protein product [Phytomonas sp. isolate Hart1]
MDSNLQWRGENNTKSIQKPPRTLAEFRAIMDAKRNRKNRRSIDSEEEEELFYSLPSGYPCKNFFRFLSSASHDVRIRIERIYWNSWSSAVRSILLSGFGIIFLILGLLCLFSLRDAPRGFVILFLALLLCVPGFYSLHVLLMHLCGYTNYSYHLLSGSN